MQLIGAVHGAHYFLVWDNAAFFAANALVEDVFVLMISFTTGRTRPVSGDVVTVCGKVINTNRSPFNRESVFYDDHR